MTADLPGNLLALLAVLTLLGAVIGYCVAMIRAKNSARKAIELARREMTQENRAAASSAQASLRRESRSGESGQTSDGTAVSADRTDTYSQAHTVSQDEHIKALEAQVASLEDKQLRLQRDFASYKTTKTRQLELARSASSVLSDTHNLPTLSRRVEPSGRARRDDLSYPLSSELDIPALAESELSVATDDLEFDLADSGSSGVKPRG